MKFQPIWLLCALITIGPLSAAAQSDNVTLGSKGTTPILERLDIAG